MQVLVMKQATLTRLENIGKSATCRHCGEPIEEGELWIIWLKRNKGVYAHKRCDEEKRI